MVVLHCGAGRSASIHIVYVKIRIVVVSIDVVKVSKLPQTLKTIFFVEEYGRMIV